MITGYHKGELAVITLLCVLTIFFFPATQGPYSAVRGPVTSLSTLRSAAHLQISIAQAGSSIFDYCLISTLAVLFSTLCRPRNLQLAALPENSTLQRC
jgi:hypothetical protein